LASGAPEASTWTELPSYAARTISSSTFKCLALLGPIHRRVEALHLLGEVAHHTHWGDASSARARGVGARGRATYPIDSRINALLFLDRMPCSSYTLNARAFGTSKRVIAMPSHLMRRKPQAELLKTVRSTCAPSLPRGQYRGLCSSSRLEGKGVAISRRFDSQLANEEALL
jgi:hypothetical protein